MAGRKGQVGVTVTTDDKEPKNPVAVPIRFESLLELVCWWLTYTLLFGAKTLFLLERKKDYTILIMLMRKITFITTSFCWDRTHDC